MAETLPKIKEAATLLKNLSKNKKIRAAYEQREQEIRDELMRMNSAERKGIKIGKQEKTIEIAKSLLSFGVDINIISKILD